ncbi:DUF3017 domain-containing protein [Amycolatopsis suaedae]|uniref:DUF3017 domain-containing protein n=1 Tax=Amycolatopsis suaedae TaxID=2510978 RepID=A0A4Q7J7L0_9PSEU|nr:DUF3017 domain-containing protein [Amycolatopsis suaedae]RZQ62908.1 DUF3017 domain-containing protein [Amycolatopsis suaedae]
MLIVLVAGVRIWQYHWRQGAALIAVALLVAAGLRAVLPEVKAGLLAIRGKAIDVLSYLGFAVVILFVALTITGGPFG